ncbi:DUF4203 domain-containing protein [Cellulomonas sp. HZM]|uniref:DUF4203 domain-containing protein n=1 Tax=Cellulomonas sp. HZM TaxID=1454010 RepID=UPI0018CC66AB|nr:DUF4203 domain-containing protein [Cellulomonas sp. HZM]
MSSGVVVLLIGLLLCFWGIGSVNLALLASGFAVGYLVGDALGATGWDLFWIALGTGIVAWLVVSLVFRFATFVIGLVTGAVIGSKIWSALGNDATSVLLGIVLVLVVAYAAATLAEKYHRRALLWFTALGGASLTMSGIATVWPSLGLLAHPDDGWQQLVMTVVWLALSGAGWWVQRQIFRKRLGLPPKEPKQAATVAAPVAAPGATPEVATGPGSSAATSPAASPAPAAGPSTGPSAASATTPPPTSGSTA